MIMFFCISPQVKRWFYEESEKHLAPLDSYSLSLSSIQDMRQSLAQFMEESTVSVHVVSNAERKKELACYCPRTLKKRFQSNFILNNNQFDLLLCHWTTFTEVRQDTILTIKVCRETDTMRYCFSYRNSINYEFMK